MTQQTVVSFAVLASVSMLVALFGPTKFGEDFLHNDQVYVPETKVHTHTKTYEQYDPVLGGPVQITENVKVIESHRIPNQDKQIEHNYEGREVVTEVKEDDVDWFRKERQQLNEFKKLFDIYSSDLKRENDREVQLLLTHPIAWIYVAAILSALGIFLYLASVNKKDNQIDREPITLADEQEALKKQEYNNNNNTENLISEEKYINGLSKSNNEIINNHNNNNEEIKVEENKEPIVSSVPDEEEIQLDNFKKTKEPLAQQLEMPQEINNNGIINNNNHLHEDSKVDNNDINKQNKEFENEQNEVKPQVNENKNEETEEEEEEIVEDVEDEQVEQTEQEEQAEQEGGRKMRIGAVSLRGRRLTNEDEHVSILKLTENTSYFAVFDGHGGRFASSYCKEKLHENIIVSEHWPEDVNTSLIDAFVETNASYEEYGKEDGTTAVVALLVNDTLHVANLGDSRCLLIDENGNVEPLTRDHKPNLEDEKERIIASGHEVTSEMVLLNGKQTIMYRIDDIIACSRSIGDSSFKDNDDLPPEEQAVTCVPEIREFKVHSGQFLLLGCDGLFDVLSNEQVAEFIHSAWKTEQDLNLISSLLANEAIQQGSDDNVSVLIVKIDSL